MPDRTPSSRAYLYLGTLSLGYVGIYLCRKNLAVALPLIQESFGVDKGAAGMIASVSTVAYALGKLVLGPVVEKLGGRNGFLISMVLVAVFCALGGVVPTLTLLAGAYSFNRFSGAAGWSAMVKQVPDWFGAGRMATAMALLSLSFVGGGVCALLLAGEIAERFGTWQAVMGLPSAVLLSFTVVCWVILPRPEKSRTAALHDPARPRFLWREEVRQLRNVITNRNFLVICGLSFTLTLMRETFNTWAVDFLNERQGDPNSLGTAARLSSLFDAWGFIGILMMGWVYDRLKLAARRWTLFGILALLAVVVGLLAQIAAQFGIVAAAVSIGLIGFLVYGPYSLLAGVMAVEVHGKERAATVASWVDASGYFAAILAGTGFGELVDHGGYELGFHVLAGVLMVAAVLCLFLAPLREGDWLALEPPESDEAVESQLS